VKAPRIIDLTFAVNSGAAFFALALGLSARRTGRAIRYRSAQDTVDELEHNGFKVVLNKMGAAPLDHCTVDSVRPGETITRLVQNGNELVNQTVYQTVYLTARC
jgi:hypothetical protein